MLRLEFYLFIAEKPINSQFIYANVTSAEVEASSINVTSEYFVTRIANDCRDFRLHSEILQH